MDPYADSMHTFNLFTRLLFTQGELENVTRARSVRREQEPEEKVSAIEWRITEVRV